MSKKLGFWLIWIGLISYGFLFAPPDRPETLELIKNLSLGKWEGIDPLIIALFNIMGIWPMVYASVLFIDGRGQKIPAWAFVTASFAVGAFAILPYLALRQSHQEFTGSKTSFIKLLDSRWLGFALSLGTLVLLGFGLTQGDWGDFITQWQTSKFIHVMSLDFCMLSLLFPTLLGDDMARRGMKNELLFWIVAFLPLIGPLLYLCLRTPLLDNEEELSTALP
ncbi:MAG TPA: DUF2834 domain-containing protein [Cyanobacteria bacterium UBA11149]|nr:DUF2834 domain-containing protein [Cyanobacteria bacterium UBA11367]HBE58787.1 DUF2834 domain-containing protein [Cyanobacteria bacterium UBA11366]HBK66317.1 DUF2834 domain-containing protein [Cyanobacteria bacterium UBA11166]HBR77135.1 DUF2834 domain-containing protein [Cyanobacteria bacterium UBA11159]HBS67623.1 DUF2834 domain-containing protein [Cyanobacteria bacterium UBA11153]HBW87647.1 DUF2834 domain-containing protein [Cyanobacteria bacterium UBA11149]HCA96704.1 DUF2834 domain-conta